MHNNKLITKKQEDYVVTASTAPDPCKHLINKSLCHDPFINDPWMDETFDNIDWKIIQSSFKPLPPSKKIQISKFVHDWTPTLHHCTTMDNSIDCQCFACKHLKENVDHVI